MVGQAAVYELMPFGGFSLRGEPTMLRVQEIALDLCTITSYQLGFFLLFNLVSAIMTAFTSGGGGEVPGCMTNNDKIN